MLSDLSLPTIVGREGVVQVLELPLDDDEVRGLRQSAAVLKEVARSLEV